MRFFTTRRMVRTAVIAALYTAITLALAPISYGAVQFRVSEALGVLPLFCPEAVIGLTIGCFISNMFSPNALILDLVFGTLATFASAFLTFLIGKKIRGDERSILGIMPPILINAFVVPFTFLALTELKEAYFFNVLSVGAGQAAVLVLIGIPLYFVSKRTAHNIFK